MTRVDSWAAARRFAARWMLPGKPFDTRTRPQPRPGSFRYTEAMRWAKIADSWRRRPPGPGASVCEQCGDIVVWNNRAQPQRFHWPCWKQLLETDGHAGAASAAPLHGAQRSVIRGTWRQRGPVRDPESVTRALSFAIRKHLGGEKELRIAADAGVSQPLVSKDVAWVLARLPDDERSSGRTARLLGALREAAGRRP